MEYLKIKKSDKTYRREAVNSDRRRERREMVRFGIKNKKAYRKLQKQLRRADRALENV